MSNKICYHDQRKLNSILEQVKTLSDIVDHLRTELNNLKKVPLDVSYENVFFESTKEDNEIDRIRLNVARKVKTCSKNIGTSTRTEELYQLIQDTQACKSYPTSSYVVDCKKQRDQKPSAIRFSTIYGGLKILINKIIKNIQSIQQSPKNTEHKYVTSNQQEAYLLQNEEFFKFDTKNKDVTTYTDVSEELGDSTDNSFTSDVSAQIVLTPCSWQEDNKKLFNCNHLLCQNMTENSVQTNPLSVISDDLSMIYSNQFIKLSKNYIKQTLLKNKIKKYKKCSCEEQCPYVLYNLPCNKYKCNTSEKKINDEIGELVLECLNFREKNNFSKLLNDTVRERNGKCSTDPIESEVDEDESSTSSLSVDLEVNVCNNYHDLKNIDEFYKRKRAKTYIVNKMNTRKNDDLIKSFSIENEPLSNVISSSINVIEKKEKINKKTETKDAYTHLIESLNQTCDLNNSQNKRMPVRAYYPYICNNTSAEKHKKHKKRYDFNVISY